MRIALAFLFILAAGCTKKPAEAPAASLTPEQLVESGRKAYMANCTACHNSDPSKAGSIGPEIKGSSLELIEARVMNAKYPSGYQPKRNTTNMVALPHLQKDIPALHAFLNANN